MTPVERATLDEEAGQRARRIAHAGLFLMTVIWALNFVIIKIGLASVPAMAFNALRYPLASITVYLILRRSGPIPRPRGNDVWRVLALGFLGNFLYQLFFITGVDHTRAGTASLLLASTPIITALLSAALGHERVTPRMWIGAFAAFLGLALVVLGNPTATTEGLHLRTGDLIMVLASFSWAIYTVGSKKLIDRYGSLPFTAWTMWVGTIGLIAVGMPEMLALRYRSVPAFAWLALIYSGVLSIGVAYVLWYHGVRRIGNARTSAYSNLVPVLALLFAWLWLGEVPTGSQMLGAFVIIAGVTLARSGAAREFVSA
jgi:drug/metabolite transporter (DMT)-like permease